MRINYRTLRESVRIEEVLSWMSWEATRRVGEQLRGRCPFCAKDIDDASSGAAPSVHRTFSVNTRRNIFRCFKCQRSGNALDLWSMHRQLPIYAAAQEIQHRLDQNKQPPKRT